MTRARTTALVTAAVAAGIGSAAATTGALAREDRPEAAPETHEYAIALR